VTEKFQLIRIRIKPANQLATNSGVLRISFRGV